MVNQLTKTCAVLKSNVTKNVLTHNYNNFSGEDSVNLTKVNVLLDTNQANDTIRKQLIDHVASKNKNINETSISLQTNQTYKLGSRISNLQDKNKLTILHQNTCICGLHTKTKLYVIYRLTYLIQRVLANTIYQSYKFNLYILITTP
jgi:hypothetical protein